MIVTGGKVCRVEQTVPTPKTSAARRIVMFLFYKFLRELKIITKKKHNILLITINIKKGGEKCMQKSRYLK